MKHRPYVLLVIMILIISGCKKNPQIKPINFPDASYQSLVPYNSQGKPDNLLKDTIPTTILDYANQTIKKGVNMTISHPEFFTSNTNADLQITKPSTEVFVTFVRGNANFSNTLAFYTYPTNQPPQTDKDVKLITYIFPNAGSQSPLSPGDKISLGTFDVGTTIGFVILQNGWQPSKSSLNSNVVHFCSTDPLNPETNMKLKKHAISYKNYISAGNKFLISFEDFDRANPACDNDFGDMIFYCTVSNP